MIKKGASYRQVKRLLILLALTLILSCAIGTSASCKTTNRYATQTIRLRSKAGGKVMLKIKRNTKVVLIKQGKKWSRVRYKGDNYSALTKYLSSEKAVKKYKGAYFKRAGVIRWRSKKYTWYSQRVLPGRGLKIPGRHVDSEGFVCDKRGYIVLGSCRANRGKILATPFGKFGKVYDAGYVTSNWYDCYTDW